MRTIELLRPAVVGLAVAVIVVADRATVATAQSNVQFRDTPAAQAFLAKDYALALEEFEKLREANPGNLLVLRYLAITLDQLGRYDEALAVYDEALAAASDNPELHYHRAVTAYNAQRGAEAVASFRRAAELAPGSRYAELAVQYLDAIAQQYAQRQAPGKPKRFGIYAMAGFQHDDNIPAQADDVPGTSDGERFTGYFNLDYYLHQSSRWQATASVNGYGSWYRDGLFDEFEIPQYMGSLRLQRSGSLGSLPYIGSIDYDHRLVERADGELYSRSNAVTLGLRVTFKENTATYAYYRYTDDSFEDEGFNPVFSSRDADNHYLGLRQTWFFAEGRGNVSAEINYERNIADGLNFDMEGYSATLSAVFPLPAGFRTDVSVTYGEEDYDKFAGPVIRETTRRQVSLGLSRRFGQRLYTRVDYNYLDEESSYDVLTFDRTVWGMSLSYVY